MTTSIESKSEYIRNIRESLGLGRTEFANLLGMSATGERTVRGWEEGEHSPTAAKWNAILKLEDVMRTHLENAPFRHNPEEQSRFKFIDLFAGIGGIRLPFQRLGGECVFTSEWDKFAQKTYLANYGEMPNGDITKIKAADIADHDILLGGFPCQAFSQAGLKQGFSDTRGTMFFEIQRILVEKRPRAFLLENVKQLRGHDKGRTLKTIVDILNGNHDQQIPEDIPMSEESRHALTEKLNYWVDFKVLRAADFGAPQNRERIFIVGFDKDYFSDVDFSEVFKWPTPPCTPTRVGDILQSHAELRADEEKHNKDVYTISDRLWTGHQKRKEEHKTKGNGFGYTLYNADSEYTNTISARYYKDGSEILIDQSELGKNPRKLTPRECARLQGFPENFIVDAVSQGQIYKQFGNSVCMKVIEAVAEQLVEALDNAEVLVQEERMAG
ncbi:DNA (cytosine-5-)-methyltransferase [Vibrio parahaemolyticus]|uniref:DNA (cytosine-5-)-methyltransferase n=3 Tax=Vibrio parahaemolyticus TaxID=670 RepID=UPI0011223AEC|nr:DNA (cytosine-5-)-methyltransferase [Vibrio parahaemolyticus]ELA9311745.1 DNA (cytosine-5-)-methyltransferase [Vibrio parahaemolyticus]MBE4142945.1 DNA (cytosine-5-)-methyltransferase [Vibrio parahaemolyticus]MDF4800616.1 DNA (cytosine-5-)-methyltransferase [Vibrio parahaemolyticus]MDF4851238.1 DNA (cytosine-5-)-methyltransferase [Vibrio parahaemolyticus]TOE18528.1 DNA (cytosine-5-)-methyltransferase [Vibrio parahaemolyticus]